jgi:hypothetical protein
VITEEETPVKSPWGFKKEWRKAKRATEAAKEEAAKIAGLPPIERQRLAALDAIAQ